MDLSGMSCRNCNTATYVHKTWIGHWDKPWRGKSSVFLRVGVPLWTCPNCESYVITPGDSERLDAALLASYKCKRGES